MRALNIFAGPAALLHLQQHGLSAHDVRVVPAAAGCVSAVAGGGRCGPGATSTLLYWRFSNGAINMSFVNPSQARKVCQIVAIVCAAVLLVIVNSDLKHWHFAFIASAVLIAVGAISMLIGIVLTQIEKRDQKDLNG
jgi:peptidoglycan/LPS O-acetylase OafA/YrhL